MLLVSNCSECDDSGSYLDSDVRELTDLTYMPAEKVSRSRDGCRNDFCRVRVATDSGLQGSRNDCQGRFFSQRVHPPGTILRFYRQFVMLLIPKVTSLVISAGWYTSSTITLLQLNACVSTTPFGKNKYFILPNQSRI